MRLFLTISLILSVTLAFAQKAKIRWEDETCSYESSFDSTKVSRQQIGNCLRMAKWNEFSLQSSPWVFRPSDIPKIDSNKLYTEYANKSKELKNLDLPNTTFWQEYRKKAVEEQDELFRIFLIRYRSYDDTRALYACPYSDSCIAQHIKALNSDTTELLNDWYLLRQSMARKNGSPGRVMSEYENMRSSELRFTYAKVDIIGFGWWNCVNKHIIRAKDVYDDDNVLKEIDALFIKTKTIDCEQP